MAEENDLSKLYATMAPAIEEWFKEHDKDGNGSIDQKECDGLIDQLYEDAKNENPNLTKEQFKAETTSLFDKDGNGLITKEEFVRAVLISFNLMKPDEELPFKV